MVDNNIVESVTHYPFSGVPTIVDGTIKENCEFEISLMGDTMIIDKEFIDEILSNIKNMEGHQELIGVLNFIRKIIKNYFYSESGYDKSRGQFYGDKEYGELDNEGATIGTKMSKTKGKNIAQCTEKSVTAYILLDLLFREGKINHKPSLVLSSLSTENTRSGLHAFLILDKDNGVYPTKTLLFDPENDMLVETDDGLKYIVSGLYALTEEERDNLINGVECMPTPIYDAMNAPCHYIGENRTYGSIESSKSK